MNHFWQYFRLHFVQSLEIVVEWPVVGVACTLLAVGLMASLALEKPFVSGRWKRSYWWALTQLLFFPAVVALGVLYSADPLQPHHKVNPLGYWGIGILFFLSLALSSFWVYRTKELRWSTFYSLALHQVLLFVAAVGAVISVAGSGI
jgi:hypothetical protein